MNIAIAIPEDLLLSITIRNRDWKSLLSGGNAFYPVEMKWKNRQKVIED
jgi:hypothetical protein